MPLVNMYTKFVSKRLVIIFGFCLIAVSMLFVGNSPRFYIPESLTYTMFGLVLLGIGFSSIVVPIFPEMLEGVEKRYPEYRNSD